MAYLACPTCVLRHGPPRQHLDWRDTHARARPASRSGPRLLLRTPTTLPQVPAFPPRPPPRPEAANTHPPTPHTAARRRHIRPPPHNWHKVVCALETNVSCSVAGVGSSVPVPSATRPTVVRSKRMRQGAEREMSDRQSGAKAGATDAEGRRQAPGRAAGRADPDRAAVRQGHRDADGRPGRARRRRRDPDRRAVARHRARDRRRPARPDHRDLRPGVLGQDDARLPHPRRGPEARRRVRVRRRRALRWTRSTRRRSGSTSTSCWSPSPTTASRRSRSSTC